jgi:hypothetical protein
MLSGRMMLGLSDGTLSGRMEQWTYERPDRMA